MIEFNFKITDSMLKKMASYIYDETVWPLNEREINFYTKKSCLLSKKKFVEEFINDKKMLSAILQSLNSYVYEAITEEGILNNVMDTYSFNFIEVLENQVVHVNNIIKENDYEKTMAAQEDNMIKTLESRGYTVIKED